MFARFQDVKQGLKFDADNEDLSHVEQSLNKLGIALRSDTGTFRNYGDVINDLSLKWKNLSEVQQSDVAKSFAGTRQRENFIVLMNNMTTVTKLQSDQMDSAGSAMVRYGEFSKSTEARLNDLTNASQKMWMSLIHSSTINSFIGGMTSIVTVMGRVATGLGSVNTVILLLSSSIILLNSKAIGSLITEFLAMATGETILSATTVGLTLAMESLGASMLALLTSPVTWIIASIGLVVAGIVSWTNHQQKLKEQTDAMTESQSNLNKAIKEQDMGSIKSEYDKQKAEFEKLDKLKSDYAQKQKEYDKLSSSNTNSRFGSAEMNKLSVEMQKESKAIDEQEKLLKGLNSTMDDYLIAKSLLYAQDNADKINKEAKAEFDNKQNIISLIQEYQNLEGIENKNATQKERLSQLSEELSGKISGLKLSTDAHGNSIISNSDLLTRQINILQTEGSTVETLANVKLTTAKNEAEIEIGKTKITYTEAKKRIEMYKLEAKSASDAIDSAKTKTEQNNAINGALYSGVMHGGFIDTYSSAIDALDKIYSLPTASIKQTNTSYMPPKGSPSTGSNSSEKQENSALIQKDRYYKLNQELLKTQNLLDINKSLQENLNNDNLEDKIKLQKQEITLLEKKQTAQKNIENEQTKERNEITKSLTSKGVKFNGLDPTNADTILQNKLDQVNAHRNDKDKTVYNKLKTEYDDYNTSLTRFFTLQNTEIPKTKAEYTSLATEIHKVSEALDSITITNITDKLSKDISNSDDIISNLENSSKYNYKSDDYISQLEILKQKESTYKDEIFKTNSTLDKLNSTQVTTVEGQKQLEDSIASTTKTLNGQKIALLETQEAQKTMAKTMLTNLIETQQKIDEMNMEQKHKNEITSLASSVYGMTGDSADDVKAKYDKQNQIAQDAIQTQIDNLNKVNDIQEEIETRLKNQNDLIEKQNNLTNIQSEKNVRIYKDGEWQWSADPQAVKSAQDAVNDQIKSNQDFEKSTALKHQIETLSTLKQSLADQKKVKDDDYAERLRILETNQTNETNVLTLHYSDMNILVDTKLKELKGIYGDNWKDIITQLTTDVGTATTLYNSLADLKAKTGNITPPSTGSKNWSGSDKGTVSIGNQTWTAQQINDPAYEEEIRKAVVSGKEIKIAQFADGGQLPMWGSNPKLAYVDEGEVISNKIDSKLLLKASELLKTIDISKNIMANIPKFNLPNMDLFSKRQSSDINSGDTYNFKDITIQADDISSFVNQMKTFVAVH